MRIEAFETFRVAPERLKPLLADIDSLNREIGLPSVEYTFAPLPQGGSSVRGRARVGPGVERASVRVGLAARV